MQPGAWLRWRWRSAAQIDQEQRQGGSPLCSAQEKELIHAALASSRSSITGLTLLRRMKDVSGPTEWREISGNHARNDTGALWSRFYNIVWSPAMPLALFLAGGDAQSRRERMGRASLAADPSGRGKLRVWTHAASVGEIEGVRPIAQQLASLRPNLEFVTTTMTAAGRDAARRRLTGTTLLAPFDHPAAVRRFLSCIRPALLMVTETELWPNFFFEAAAAGVRVALINARLSARSMRRYRLVRPLIARALSNAQFILAQTEADAARFRHLGAPPERIIVTGNAKYEVRGDLPLRPALTSFAAGRPILIAGSTAPGEEQIVLTAYRRLVAQYPTLALVLAPRHLERNHEVERILQATGLRYVRASELDDAPEVSEHQDKGLEQTERMRLAEPCVATKVGPDVLLLDTMGELSALYKRATVTFVGGSLTPGRGGQSLAEPANASVPVLFGPYHENHRQLGDALVAAECGRVVRNAIQLAEASAQWLGDEAARIAAGHRAQSILQQFAGSSAATVGYISSLLPAA